MTHIDTTAGGAKLIATLTGLVTAPNGKQILRTSPTIMRQQLLSIFRIINRQCFSGQLDDPIVHMLHEDTLGVDGETVPMKFWVQTGTAGPRPTISVTKTKLMVRSDEELFPELREMVARYWVWRENPQFEVALLHEHKDYPRRLEYIMEKAPAPTFIAITPDSAVMDTTARTLAGDDTRSSLQAWIDTYLLTLPRDILTIISKRTRDLSEADQLRKGEAIELARTKHGEQMKRTPKPDRFSPPSPMMLSKRAELFLDGRSMIALPNETDVVPDAQEPAQAG